jgi:hypothetical protein
MSGKMLDGAVGAASVKAGVVAGLSTAGQSRRSKELAWSRCWGSRSWWRSRGNRNGRRRENHKWTTAAAHTRVAAVELDVKGTHTEAEGVIMEVGKALHPVVECEQAGVKW